MRFFPLCLISRLSYRVTEFFRKDVTFAIFYLTENIIQITIEQKENFRADTLRSVVVFFSYQIWFQKKY
jgi:hypothetical protein